VEDWEKLRKIVAKCEWLHPDILTINTKLSHMPSLTLKCVQ